MSSGKKMATAATRSFAADKLVLLRRLVELTDDAAAKERVAAVAIFFPEDMRLAASPSA